MFQRISGIVRGFARCCVKIQRPGWVGFYKVLEGFSYIATVSARVVGSHIKYVPEHMICSPLSFTCAICSLALQVLINMEPSSLLPTPLQARLAH